MNKNIIDEINNKTDIVALVSSYVKLERRGKNYFGLCPFHDDTNPSMSVSPDLNFFKCFSCGEGGSPLDFYQKINHISFNEALAALAEPLGIKVGFSKQKQSVVLPEHEILEEVKKFYEYSLNNSKLGEEALKYLKQRKLKPETISHFKIGLAPKNNAIYKLLKSKNFTEEQMLNSGIVSLKNNEYKDFFNERIMFPISNVRGDVVGFSGRAIGNKTPKYYNSQDSNIFNKSEVLYHLYEALGDIRKQGHIIIHEGFFDCISSYEAGIKNTVATMGTALTFKQAKQIENYTKRVVLALDGDSAGVNAAIKAIEVLKQTNLRIDVLKFPENLDPDDFLKKYGKEKYKNLYKNNLVDQYEFIYEATKENLNLNNVNDVSLLKNTTRTMLNNAALSTKELYLKRLSTDLGVSISSLNREILTEIEKRPIKKEIKKQPKKVLPNKYYSAEQQLIFNMLQDKEKATRIEQSLGSNHVCDIRAFKVRYILQYEYYLNHENYDEELFVSLVKENSNDEDALEYLKELFKTDMYKQNFEFSEEDVEKLIDVVKDARNQNQYNETFKNILKETESYQKTIHIEELKKKKIEKINKKEAH